MAYSSKYFASGYFSSYFLTGLSQPVAPVELELRGRGTSQAWNQQRKIEKENQIVLLMAMAFMETCQDL